MNGVRASRRKAIRLSKTEAQELRKGLEGFKELKLLSDIIG